MKRNIKIILVNPAGNITIFVVDQFDRSQYQAVAGQLLAMTELKAEQVAFIKEPYEGVDGKMEMCGLEFCGNASRSFGLICAKNAGLEGHCKTVVDVSGCDENLTVELDVSTNYTKINMPLPLAIHELTDGEISALDSDALKPLLDGAQIVDMDGIVHVILRDKIPSEDSFLLIKQYINDKYNPPAMGVMFYNTALEEMVPVVYVADVDSTYWEGSCGSGSTAAAAAFSCDNEEGTYSYVLKQPAGTITATVDKGTKGIKNIFIEGPVSISPEFEVEIDL